MKFLAVVFLLPFIVFASGVYVTEVMEPYALISINEDVTVSQLHLGGLNNFPVMYEFTLSTTTNFRAELAQPVKESPNPLTLMLVRRDDRGGGVTEIARLSPGVDNWSIVKDSAVGSSFWEAKPVEIDLGAGTYRVEVSTPDNVGKYLLSFGPDPDYGYFANLSRVWTTQQFLEYSPVRMLTSNLVYYPLGILLLGLLISKTWKYRKLISNAA